MRIPRILTILAFVYGAYLLEFVLYNAFGPWGRPELMVLVFIFCNLYWGIRYSVWAAVSAGVLRDAFGIGPFGTYVGIYIAAAYLSTFIRRNWYQPGSRASRLFLTFLVLTAIFILEVLLRMRMIDVRLPEALGFIFIPQTAVTLIVATFIFHWLRDLVVKFKI